MRTLMQYETKVLLAIAAVICFAGSSMGYTFPTASVVFRVLGWAFLVWSIVEPKQEVE